MKRPEILWNIQFESSMPACRQAGSKFEVGKYWVNKILINTKR